MGIDSTQDVTLRVEQPDNSVPREPWQDLRQLAELPGPEWRLPTQRRAELRLVRAFEHFVETVCLADGGLVAVSRCPIAGRSPRTIATENFAGSLRDAVEFLRRPPRWEEKHESNEENPCWEAVLSSSPTSSSTRAAR
jgi:hypothetical protein